MKKRFLLFVVLSLITTSCSQNKIMNFLFPKKTVINHKETNVFKDETDSYTNKVSQDKNLKVSYRNEKVILNNNYITNGAFINYSQPLILNDKIIFMNASGSVSCYTLNGKKIWKNSDLENVSEVFLLGTDLHTFYRLSIISYDKETSTIVLSNGGGKMLGINSKTGESIWISELDKPTRKEVNFIGDFIIVEDFNSGIFLVNKKDGKIVLYIPGISGFQAYFKTSISYIDSNFSVPFPHKDSIIIIQNREEHSELAKYQISINNKNINFKLLDQSKIRNDYINNYGLPDLKNVKDITLENNQNIIVSSYDGYISKITGASPNQKMTIQWSKKYKVNSKILTENESIYFASKDSKIANISQKNGAMIWYVDINDVDEIINKKKSSKETFDEYEITHLTIYKNYILAIVNSNMIFFINKKTGKIKEIIKLKHTISCVPSIDKASMYFITLGGSVVKINLKM